MSNNNVVFTKDGMRVRVKQIKNESYVDATQSWVVKAWNLGSEKAPNKQYAHPHGTVAAPMARGFC